MNDISKLIIETVSGRVIDLNDFKGSDINTEDVAVSLSRIRRYNGHTVVPWSVGQHIIFCSMIADRMGADPVNIKASFLHDIEEYLIQDLINPIKNSKLVSKHYDKTSNRISKVVYDEFDCVGFNPGFVNIVDQLAYCFEHIAFRPHSPNKPQVPPKVLEKFEWLLETLKFGIPAELVNMSEDAVANIINEHLIVFRTEKVLGGEISSDVDELVNSINETWRTSDGQPIN